MENFEVFTFKRGY